jgi:hypothetical protein
MHNLQERAGGSQKTESLCAIKFKILQVNLNRSAAAQDLATATAIKEQVDIMATSEPNKNKTGRQRNTYTNENKDVSLIIFGDQINIYSYGSGVCFVWVETMHFFVYSVYIRPSPIINLEEFNRNLQELEQDVRFKTKNLVITGDFNSKHTVWGGEVTDKRGKALLEWTNSMDLILLNEGNSPTLVRGTGTSYIDLTMVSEGIMQREPRWKVLHHETLSDHRYILVDLSEQKRTLAKKGFKLGKTDMGKYPEVLKQELQKRNYAHEISTCVEAMTKAYEKCTPKIRMQTGCTEAYWWTDDITELRKDCRKKRRAYQRTTRDDHQRAVKQEEYARARKMLRKQIGRSKREKWRDLCEDLERDPFGQGYKIVMSQLKLPNPRLTLTKQQRREIFEDLFMGAREHPYRMGGVEDPPLFSGQEIAEASARIKSGKAPGPDNLTPEVVKRSIEAAPEYFKQVFNNLLRQNEFPEDWKRTALVLIDKPKKSSEEETKYRPICLISALGKVYENLINKRLMEDIEQCGGLGRKQFGFRKNRSTVDAIEEVLSTVRGVNGEKPEWSALTLVDVKNAFNTASWELIVKKLEKRQISRYLLNIIKKYLSGRRVSLDRSTSEEIGGGVPQGSVLGPTLWNILYDDVMEIEAPEGVSMVCYADDLAIVVTASTREDMILKGNETLHSTKLWMAANKLIIAEEKTVATILNRKRKLEGISFSLGNCRINPAPWVKYLGVTLDRGLRFGRHIKEVTEKAAKTAKALGSILPNVNGPRSSKRRVLCAVIQSIILYAAPVWQSAMNHETNRALIKSAQRLASQRICSAYRTVSYEGLMVVAGTIPLHLLAEERKMAYKKKLLPGYDFKDQRRHTMAEWQKEWQETSNAAWTRRLIKEVAPWVERRFGEIDFYMTQCLTGHGCFMAYVKRIGKRQSATCMYCADEDDAEHTLFVCPRWHDERRTVMTDIQEELDPDNLVEIMLNGERNWKRIQKYIKDVMKRKEKDETRAQLE